MASPSTQKPHAQHISIQKKQNIKLSLSLTFNKRTALAFEHPRSSSNRLRNFVASSKNISRSITQLDNVLSDLR